MLGWLAGHRPSDNGFDSNITTVTEAPETPAPVFAVRAFKHAIFGTPQTQQLPKLRRYSATDSPRLQGYENGPSRPTMIRPKSWHDAQWASKEQDVPLPEPLPSPTKGILVTPGTAAARRKTVSFGDQVKDNETRRVPKSGLPDDFPGKFPSPWVKPAEEHLEAGREEGAGMSKGRNKLTEALEQARDDSARRKGKADRSSKCSDEALQAMGSSEPHADSARYWKQEYDIYRENTTREVKKLVAKQKAAKSFARDKDMECAELREQLRLEQRKALLLEKRTDELEAQLREFQEKLQRSHAEEHQAKQEIGQLRRQNSTLGGTRLSFAEQVDVAKGERKERRTLARPRSTVLQTSSNVQSKPQPDGCASHVIGQEYEQLPPQDQPDIAKARSHPRRLPRTTQGDHKMTAVIESIVSQSDASPAGKTPVLKLGSQPMRNVATNAVPQDTRSVALSMGLQLPSPSREPRRDSPMHSPDWPRINPDDPPIKASEQTLEEPRLNGNNVATPNLSSSPFIPDAASERPPSNDPVVPEGAKAAARVAATQPMDNEENISPVFNALDLASKDDDLKPSAAWHGLTTGSKIAGASGGKRIMSKDGQEVGAVRIAAARARILARGRQTS